MTGTGAAATTVAALRRPRAGEPTVEVALASGERIAIHDRRLIELGLVVGTAIQPDRAAALRRAGAADAAERRALRLIARRPRSRTELARRLAEWGVEAGDVEGVLGRLARMRALDDGALAAAVVAGRRARAYGRLRVQFDLDRLEVDPAAGAALAATSAEAEAERARQALGSRRDLETGDPAALRRAAAFLTRRGFDAETVATVLRLDADS